MKEKTPSFSSILDQTRCDIQSRLALPQGKMPGVLDALASVHASMVQGVYSSLHYYKMQSRVEFAEGDFLDHIANAVGIRRHEPTAAVGKIFLKAQGSFVLKKGEILVSSSGARYATQNQVVFSDDGNAEQTKEVGVMAMQVGKSGNLESFKKLYFEKRIVGLQEVAEIKPDGLQGGADKESDALLRNRVVRVNQGKMRYGKRGDFEFWAMESHPLVVRAWERPHADASGLLQILCAGKNLDALGDPVINAARQHIQTLCPLGVRWDIKSIRLAYVSLDVHYSGHDSEDDIQFVIKQWLESNTSPGAFITTTNVSELEGFVIRLCQGVQSVSISVLSAPKTLALDECLYVKEIACKRR